MLTFKNIQDEVLRYLDQPGEDGHGLDLVKDAINRTHANRLTEDKWSFMLWPRPVSLAFVTGQRVYQLHHELSSLSDFTHSGGGPLFEVPSRQRYESGVYDSKVHFEFVSTSPVRVQPAEGVVTVSGAAKIRYIDSDGDIQEETLSSAPTSFDVVEILKVTKTDTGTLVLTDINAVSLLNLTADQYGKEYPQIRLFGNGVSGETATYRFYRKPSILTHDNDIPDIPYPYSRIMVYDSLLELATYNDSLPQAYWVDQQSRLDLQMRQAYIEGNSDSALSRKVAENDLYIG